MTNLAITTLATAKTQIGVQEIPKGSNAGPEVEIYLKSVGLGKGHSWCMAFVYWCVLQASLKEKTVNPLFKTAGVLHQFNKSQKLVVLKPQPGDIFIMDFGKGLGHTGIVEKVVGSIIHTIEGNSNNKGSREGYEVCQRKRKTNTIKAYLRL